MSGKRKSFVSNILTPALAVVIAAGAVNASAGADLRTPPVSQTLKNLPLDDVPVHEVAAIDRNALLAEDESSAPKGQAPLRFSMIAEVKKTPQDDGVWQDLPGGGRVWRLRVQAPNATDLNLGFSRFRLPAGAMMHVISERDGYFQGPYTAEDNKPHGELWTGVVPGDRAVVELHLPAAAAVEPQLELRWIGRGYRDLFAKESETAKQGSCNIDVVCAEGDEWRDEIRSVAKYTYVRSPYQYACTGTLIRDVAGTATPYFLSAWHCDVDESIDQSVVVYWNYESPSCGALSGGPLSQNQNGVIYRASREDADFVLLELEDMPDESFDVYFSGWDARTSIQPQGGVCIHHPSGDEKAISFNDDPLSTVAGVTIVDLDGNPVGTVINPWEVDNWEDGTTEGGSSGAGLWDPDTRRIVGTLSGGAASCLNPGGADYYAKFSRAWDGDGSSSRLKDWLDPGDTGALWVNGADPGGGGNGGGGGSWSCGNAGYDNNTTDTAAWFEGGMAGNPDMMFGVKFNLSDFGHTPGNVQITAFCASNTLDFGTPENPSPWPNEVFIYPDAGGSPDDSTVLGQGTIYTGDASGPYEVTLPSPVTLNGDFWLVMRGDPRWAGEDFNMEFDTAANVGQSYLSQSGISGLGLVSDGNFMLRSTLQEGGGGGGTGDGAYNYFLAAIAHTPGVGDALWRSKVGVLNRSGSSADVTFTYYWKNGPTTVKKTAVSKSIFNGRLETWDDAAVSLFGVTAKSSGSVLINSTRPLVVTARTYNVGEDGSFGSFMPGVTAADGVSTGELGILSQLTGNNDFRTNVGLVNLSNKSCEARVRVITASGATLGTAVTKTLGAHKFTQINNVFGATGAGSRNNAYATVEVLTSGCEVWAYGAVIDGTGAFPGTDDATTIPLTVIE
jgi:hypothetical protein